MEVIFGECQKHKGQSMIMCPLCKEETMKTDLEKYKETRDWNCRGFEEVYKVLGHLEDFSEEYNNKGLFKMTIKDSDEEKIARIQIDTVVLIIELEK